MEDTKYTDTGLPIISEAFIKNHMGNERVSYMDEKTADENVERINEENPFILRTIRKVREDSLDAHAVNIRGDPNKDRLFWRIYARELSIHGALCYHLLDIASDRPDRKLADSGMPILEEEDADNFAMLYGLRYLINKNPSIKKLKRENILLFDILEELKNEIGKIEIYIPDIKVSLKDLLMKMSNAGAFLVYECLRKQGEIYRLEDNYCA